VLPESVDRQPHSNKKAKSTKMYTPSDNQSRQSDNTAPLPDGVWPVAITPFDDDNKIDWKATENLIDWYIDSGVSGIFACCLSSEIYQLSRKEILDLSRFFVKTADGRVPVIAGAIGAKTMEDRVGFIEDVHQTGPAAVVLNVAEFAEKEESDPIWCRSVERLLNRIKCIDLGIYECLVPYKRIVSAEAMQWLAATERFVFFKDTSCDIDSMWGKIDACIGKGIKFYNAHAPTLLKSLKMGGNGFCGIGANFYPELFVWLCNQYKNNPVKAIEIQTFIQSVNAVIETKYPRCGKEFHFLTQSLGIGPNCRVECAHLTEPERQELELLAQKTAVFWRSFDPDNKYSIVSQT
jgi:4-hydroxy-tetrahydrodipicolinate synthase